MSPLIKDIDYYVDESGYMVFTEKFLLERGYCCGNNCRHCPFLEKDKPVSMTEAPLNNKTEL